MTARWHRRLRPNEFVVGAAVVGLLLAFAINPLLFVLSMVALGMWLSRRKR